MQIKKVSGNKKLSRKKKMFFYCSADQKSHDRLILSL